ncbi:MAG TPA: hypothetical protein VKN99_12565, partial [Polyangia bacterium]|nr:hypothetical protein [Polyangia bacterium]
AAGPWLGALAALRRQPDRPKSRALVALLALAARVPFLLHAPVGSDDWYRYLWDGRVARAGINPYRYAPAAAALSHLRDAVLWPHINHPTIPTIYPPLAQVAFLVAPSLWVWKALVLAADAAIALVLAAWLRRSGADPRRALVWAWCPLVIAELALDGHVDGLAIALLVAALALGAARPLSAGLLLGASFAAKLLAGALLPAVAQSAGGSQAVRASVPPVVRAARPGRARVYLGFAAATAVSLLPYANVGPKMLAGLEVYGRKWVAAPGAYALIYQATCRAVTIGRDPSARILHAPRLGPLITGDPGRADVFPDELANVLARALVALVVLSLLGLAIRRHLAPTDAGLLVLGAFLLLTPALLPWYVLWVVPLLAFRPALPLLALVALAPLLHVPGAGALVHLSVWIVILAIALISLRKSV